MHEVLLQKKLAVVSDVHEVSVYISDSLPVVQNDAQGEINTHVRTSNKNVSLKFIGMALTTG